MQATKDRMSLMNIISIIIGGLILVVIGVGLLSILVTLMCGAPPYEDDDSEG